MAFGLFEMSDATKLSDSWHKAVDEVCAEIECFNGFECRDIQLMKSEFKSICETKEYAKPDHSLCLAGFTEKAYRAKFKSEETCLKGFSFFDNDMTRRQSAFSNGRLCFMKYVREECTPQILDHFNSYDNYQKLIATITKPIDSLFGKCHDANHILKDFHCRAIKDEFNSRIEKLNNGNRSVPFLKESLEVCRDLEKCIVESKCKDDKEGQKTMSKNCEGLEENLN